MLGSTDKYPLMNSMKEGSVVAEAYRVLRTNLQYNHQDNQAKVLLVTSPAEGEGKSFTVSNLAVALALDERKVLIIDANLRAPKQHQIFGEPNYSGLSNVLKRSGSVENAISQTQISNLFLMPAGSFSTNPSEILSSQRLTALLEELREQYDWILIDSQAALMAADVQLFATKADGVLLVVKYGKTKKKMLQQVLSGFQLVQAKVWGAVLNQIDRKDEKLSSLSKTFG